MRASNRSLAVSLISFFLLIIFINPAMAQTAVKGILDIKNHSFFSDGNVRLDGEWEFYWDQLLDSDDIKNGKGNLTSYITVPSMWIDHGTNNVKYNAHGCATYRLTVMVNSDDTIWGIKMLDAATSYKLYVNGQYIMSNGTVTKSKRDFRPEYYPKVGYYIPENIDVINNGKYEIIIQVANYTHKKAGLWESVYIGNYTDLMRIYMGNNYIAFFMIGIFSIMAMYHLGLFILRPKDRSSLYFALFSTIMLVRLTCVGERVILQIFPQISFEMLSTLEYFGAYLQMPFILLFIYSVYSIKRDYIVIAFCIFAAFIAGSLTFTPLSVYSHFKPVWDVYLLLAGFYSLFLVIKAVIRKEQGAFLALIGFFTMLLTGINDILYNSFIINTLNLSHYGLFVFTLLQSHLLSRIFSQSFILSEKLSSDLIKINTANERFVPKEMLKFLGRKSILDVNLGDHIEKEMTILFSDIRSFTSISEKMSPEENFNFLNEYLKRVGPIIRKHNGFIDKYIGDGIMAIFSGSVEDAIDASMEIVEIVEKYSMEILTSNNISLKIGIGIHTGKMMLGMIGEESRMDGTVISDAVNMASRTQELTKFFNTSIIITDSVMNRVANRDKYLLRYMGIVRVKGKSIPISIYEILISFQNDLTKNKMEHKVLFEKGINLYIAEKYEQALNCFEEIKSKGYSDLAIEHYIEWCSSEAQRTICI